MNTAISFIIGFITLPLFLGWFVLIALLFDYMGNFNSAAMWVGTWLSAGAVFAALALTFN